MFLIYFFHRIMAAIISTILPINYLSPHSKHTNPRLVPKPGTTDTSSWEQFYKRGAPQDLSRKRIWTNTDQNILQDRCTTISNLYNNPYSKKRGKRGLFTGKDKCNKKSNE